MNPEYEYTTPKSEPWNVEECLQAPRYEDGADYVYYQELAARAGPVQAIECDLDVNPLLFSELHSSVHGMNTPTPEEQPPAIFPGLLATPFLGEPLGGYLGEPLGGPLGEPLGGLLGEPLGGPLGEPLGGPLGGPFEEPPQQPAAEFREHPFPLLQRHPALVFEEEPAFAFQEQPPAVFRGQPAMDFQEQAPFPFREQPAFAFRERHPAIFREQHAFAFHEQQAFAFQEQHAFAFQEQLAFAFHEQPPAVFRDHAAAVFQERYAPVFRDQPARVFRRQDAAERFQQHAAAFRQQTVAERFEQHATAFRQHAAAEQFEQHPARIHGQPAPAFRELYPARFQERHPPGRFEQPAVGVQELPPGEHFEQPAVGFQERPRAGHFGQPAVGFHEQPPAEQFGQHAAGFQERHPAEQFECRVVGFQERPPGEHFEQPNVGFQEQPPAEQFEHPTTGVRQQPAAVFREQPTAERCDQSPAAFWGQRAAVICGQAAEVLIQTSFYVSFFMEAPYDAMRSFEELRPALVSAIPLVGGQLVLSRINYNGRVMAHNDNVQCFRANNSAYKRDLSILGLAAAFTAHSSDDTGPEQSTASSPPIPEAPPLTPPDHNGVVQTCPLLPELVAFPESEYQASSEGETSPRAATEPIHNSGVGQQDNYSSAPAGHGIQSDPSLSQRDANNVDHSDLFPLRMDEEELPLEETDFQTLLRRQPAHFWFPELLESLPTEFPRELTDYDRLSEAVSPRTQVTPLTRLTRSPTIAMPRANYVTRIVDSEIPPVSGGYIQVYDETVEGGESERYLTLSAVWDYLIAKAEINCVDHDRVNIQLVMLALRGNEVNHGYGPAYAQNLVNEAWDNTPLRD